MEIVKSLLSRLNPTKIITAYKTKGKCVTWLTNLGDLEADMDNMSRDLGKAAMEAQLRLF